MELPCPDLQALVEGETVVAFAVRGTVDAGDELELHVAGSRLAADLKPAYRRWASRTDDLIGWTALVEAVHPSALMGPESDSRHILAAPSDGDVLVLRVFGPDGPALSDVAFEARRRSLEGALAS